MATEVALVEDEVAAVEFVAKALVRLEPSALVPLVVAAAVTAVVVMAAGEADEEEEEERGAKGPNEGTGTFWANGLSSECGAALGTPAPGDRVPVEEATGAWKRSNRERGGNGDDENGGAGMPVNSCTMARKLDVSVVSTVVGARLDALDRFRELRCGGPAAALAGGSDGGAKAG